MGLCLGSSAGVLLRVKELKQADLHPFFRLAIRDGAGKPVHLPHIPHDDVCRMAQFLLGGFAFKACLQMLRECHQHIHPCNEQVVPLKLISVGRFQRPVRPFQPLALAFGILRHHAQFAVQNADATLYGDSFARFDIIARRKVGSLSACDLHPAGVHIRLPSLTVCGEFHFFRPLHVFEKHIRHAEPHFIGMVHHLFHHP